MYTYPAGATGFDAAMPPWVQAGGLEEWIERLKDPATRAKVLAEMREDQPTPARTSSATAGAEGIAAGGLQERRS